LAKLIQSTVEDYISARHEEWNSANGASVPRMTALPISSSAIRSAKPSRRDVTFNCLSRPVRHMTPEK